MKEIVAAAQKQSPEPVDLDMLGAIGATMMDLGFSAEATWAILAVTRALSVGAHYIEETERSGYTRLGEALTPKEDYDGPPDRPVPPLKDRATVAQSGVCRTTAEWVRAREERQKAHRQRVRHRRGDPRSEQKVRHQESRKTVGNIREPGAGGITSGPLPAPPPSSR